MYEVKQLLYQKDLLSIKINYKINMKQKETITKAEANAFRKAIGIKTDNKVILKLSQEEASFVMRQLDTMAGEDMGQIDNDDEEKTYQKRVEMGNNIISRILEAKKKVLSKLIK